MAGIFTAASLLAKPAIGLSIQPEAGPPWWGRFNPALMGNVTGFTSPPSEWDVVRIGPSKQPLPGLAKILRCSRRMKLHRKEKPSSDFEDQTFLGWSALEFDFSLTLWSPIHLVALQNWLSYIFPGAGAPPNPQNPTSVTIVTSTTNLVNPTSAKTSKTQAGQQIQASSNVPKLPPLPVKASHPLLGLHGVTDLVFEKMEGPIQKSEKDNDQFVVIFKTVQWKPAVPIEGGTLKKANTSLPTSIGFVASGVGVPGQQDPAQAPSASGGANPDDATSYANLLKPLPGGQAGGATGGY